MLSKQPVHNRQSVYRHRAGETSRQRVELFRRAS